MRELSSAVQCSAVQCSAVQCSAVQCSAVQSSAVQYSGNPACRPAEGQFCKSCRLEMHELSSAVQCSMVLLV